jgi:hypothetical protein
MLLREQLVGWAAAALSVVLAGSFSSTRAQGIENILHSNARLFPEVGPDVRVIKRDSAGRYYILARPASTIWIYSAEGQRLGQIPNSHSGAATIRYAVDIDLDSAGNLYVADRGSNAVEIFHPDGSLAARVPVLAPMSLVALPNGQFAVVTLHSDSLVTIRDQKGNEVDDFGDPTELGLSSTPQSLLDMGKISGSPTGYIYFAFTSSPDPTIRKFDGGGYVVYTSALPARDFELALPSSSADDRMQFGFNMMQMNFSDAVNGWTTVGTSGDVHFGSGVGMGLGERMRGGFLGPGGGGFGGPGPQAILNDNGDGGASGPTNLNGASVFGQGSLEHGQLHFDMGANLANRRRFNRLGPGATGTAAATNGATGANGSSDAQGDEASVEGDTLQYNAPEIAGDSGSADETGTLSMTADNSLSSEELGVEPPAADTQLGTIFGGTGFQPGMFVGGQGFEPRRFFNRPLGAAPGGGGFDGGHFSGAPRAGFGPNGANGFRFGPPGRFGFGMYNVEASMRINLDRPKPQPDEKPTISAIAVDPETGEVWAGIGNALVHLDKDGNEVATYYVATPEGRPLHPSAILVEHDRLLLADDPLGIFSIARPDLGSKQPPRSNLSAQPVPPTRPHPPTDPD